MLSVHLVSLLALLGTLAHAGPIHIPSKYTKRSGACRATNGTLQAQVGAAWAGAQSGVATGGTQPSGGEGGWGGHHGWSHATDGGGGESGTAFQGHLPTGGQTGGSWGPIETESESQGVKQTGGGAGTTAEPTITETMTGAAGPSATPASASDTTTPTPPAVSTSPSPGTIATTTTSSSSTAPSGSSSDEDTLLTLHNNFRAEYGESPCISCRRWVELTPGASSLTWDSTLASYAQSYASKCVFEHSCVPLVHLLACRT